VGIRIKGEETGSIKKLKSDLKSRSGGGTWVRSIPDDEDFKVRFLTEPDQWFKYDEHYLQDVNYFPCVGDDCPGCEDDDEGRTTRRYLANALDVENDRVIPLKLPVTVANLLVSRQERYGTLMDRDYILLRQGKKLKTTYDVDSEPKSKRKLDKYDLLDLEEVLVNQFEDAFGETDDEEEERPRKGKKGKKSKSKTAKRLRVAPPSDDVDDDDDEEEVRTRSTASRRRRRR
jgi:hypothetical protein